jgi:C4-type Zn-finger protein
MFVCDCPACGRRELRGPRSLHPFPVAGGAVDWITQCRACGTSVTVVEGRRAPATPETPVPTAA